MTAFTSDFIDRFWDKVAFIPFHACWMWTADPGSKGYGQVKVNGKTRRANRVAFEIANGAIPDGGILLHSCDNPGCVRPEHLSVGTHKTNAEDRQAKGRGYGGSRHWNSRLSERQIGDVRAKYSAGGVTLKELGAQYGVCPSTIHYVVTGGTWRGVK